MFKFLFCWLWRLLNRFLLFLLGWSVPDEEIASLRNNHNKFIATFPHTSAWDGILGAMFTTVYLPDHSIYMLMLDSYFENRFAAWFLKTIGFIPVNNRVANGTVQKVCQTLEHVDRFCLGMSAEGTRKQARIRTGIHYMARALNNIPICVFNFDYKHQMIRIISVQQPDLIVENDVKRIERDFGRCCPLYPKSKSYSAHFSDERNISVVAPSRKNLAICGFIGLMTALIFQFQLDQTI